MLDINLDKMVQQSKIRANIVWGHMVDNMGNEMSITVNVFLTICARYLNGFAKACKGHEEHKNNLKKELLELIEEKLGE